MFNESIRERLNTNEYFKNLVMDIVQSAREKNKIYKVISRSHCMKNIQEKMLVGF